MIVTPDFLEEFRKDFNEAMEALQRKHNISISLGRITYEEERFSAKLSVNMTQDPEDIARANFDAEAWKFDDIGIHEGMYKRIYIGRDGKRYAIIGLKPRSYKQPIRSIGVEDGKHYMAGKGFIKEWTDVYYAEVLDTKER